MSAINQVFIGLFGAIGAAVSGLTKIVNKWYPLNTREYSTNIRWVNGKAWWFTNSQGVATSENGIDWATIWPTVNLGIPGSISLNDVAYGNGLYVMVGGATGGSSLILTSPDGSTWTRRDTTNNNGLSSIAWSPTLSMFLAVSTGGTTVYSNDGVTWVAGIPLVGISMTKVIWAGNQFAILNPNGSSSKVYRSSNGTSFTANAGSIGFDVSDIDYSPTLNLWAITRASANTAYVMTSPDLNNWTARTITGAPSSSGYGVVWVGNRFIATASGAGAASSADGITWTVQNPNAMQIGRMCATPNNVVIATATSDKGTAVTYNYGVSWATSLTEIALVQGQYRSRYAVVNSFTYAGGRYWASQTGEYGVMHYSYDKKIWYSTNLRASASSAVNYCVAYAGSAATPYWVVGGTNGSSVGQVFSSTDGDSWTLRSNAATAKGSAWLSSATNGTRVVLVNNAGAVSYTDDGVNFTAATIPTGASALRSVVYVNSRFVVIGTNAAIYSADGATWTNASASYGSFAGYKLIHDGSQFVAVGAGTATVNTKISADGITWSTGPVAPWGNSTVSSLTHNGSVYVAAVDANFNKVYVGTALTNLALVTLPAPITTAGASAGGSLVSVGSEITLQSNFNAILMTSINNGANWVIAPTAEQMGSGVFGAYNQLTLLDGAVTYMKNHSGNGYALFSTLDQDTNAFTNRVASSSSLAVYAIVKVGSTYIAGTGNTSTTGQILTSTDLTNWTIRQSASAMIRSIASNTDGSVIIAGAATGGTAAAGRYYRSINGGTSWTAITSTDINVSKVIWDGTQFVSVGTSLQPAGLVQTSPDGVTWTNRYAGANESFTDVAYGNGIYIAVSGSSVSRPKHFVSTDSINWTGQGTTNTTGMFAIAYGNGIFWSVGSNGTTYSTTNGTVYSNVTISPSSVYSIVWDGVDSFWAATNRSTLLKYTPQ